MKNRFLLCFLFVFNAILLIGQSKHVNLNVTGLEFEVPHNDIFFEELKPYNVSKA